MKKQLWLYVIFLLALAVMAVPLITSASREANTIPVVDADGVFEVSTSLSTDLSDNIADLYHPCVVRAADGVTCVDLVQLPGSVESLLSQLPDTYLAVRASDGIRWFSMTAISGTLHTLLEEIPASYLPVRASDGVMGTPLEPLSETLANLVNGIPTSYLPVRASDGVKWTPLEPLSETLASLVNKIPTSYFPARALDGYLSTSFQYPRDLLDDTLPPQIDAVNVDQVTGLVEWETDEFATSEVWYGETFGNYTHSVTRTLWTKEHAISLPDLTSNMEFFLIRSVDRSGNAGEYYFPGYSITGRVKEENGDPIPNAVVSINLAQATLYLAQATLSDANGDYTLQGVPEGQNVLTVYHNEYGFDPQSISVTVSGNLTGQDFVGKLITKPVYLPLIIR
jgi:hypothetical protein